MQNSSFDSLDLNEYTLDIKEVLSDYSINKDIWKPGYSIHEGVMVGTSQKVRIYRRPFPTSPEAKQRFVNLMAAFNQGIVLADNIFLSHEDQAYFLYVVEPLCTGMDSKFVPLSQLLKGNLSYPKKHRLFQNLIIIVKSLHELGEAHMELCPQNIWVEDEFQVYLRPFKLTIAGDKADDHTQIKEKSDARSHPKYWYSAPEYTLQLFKIAEDEDLHDSLGSMDSSIDSKVDCFSNDMWSLGCIFAEMFISMTPLFQTVEPFERIVSFFEFLGIPRKEDVFYMTKELYDTLIRSIDSRTYEDEEFPFINSFLRSLSREEAMPLKTLLSFNPDKRPGCEELIQFPFFKASTPFERKEPLQNSQTSHRSNRQEQEHEHDLMKQRYHSSRKNNEDSRPHNSLSGVKNSQSERHNNSGWWNLDLFGEPSHGGEGLRQEGSKKESLMMQAQSPTFLNQPDLNTFASQLPLGNKRKDDGEENLDNRRISLTGQKTGTKKSSYAADEFPVKSRVQFHSVSKENRDQIEENLPRQARPKSIISDLNLGGVKDSRGTGSVVIHNEGRPSLPTDMRSFTQVKQFPEDHVERQYMSHSVRSHRAFEPANTNTKLTVNIEQLKNVMTDVGSYYCRIELRTNNTNEGVISFNSELTPVQNHTVKFDFTSEINLDFGDLEKIFKEDCLSVFIFHEADSQDAYMQATEILPYGLCEISLSSLLPDPGRSFRSNVTRTLTGWYDIADPDDEYTTMGQVKVDINLDANRQNVNPGPSQLRDERENRIKMQKPNSVNYYSLRDVQNIQDRRQTTDYSYISLIEQEKENDRSMLKRLPPKTRVEKKPLEPNQSVFDMIQNNLAKLNEDLKQKEVEYNKETEAKMKRLAEAQDFENVVRKLRDIIEGDEEFCY